MYIHNGYDGREAADFLKASILPSALCDDVCLRHRPLQLTCCWPFCNVHSSHFFPHITLLHTTDVCLCQSVPQPPFMATFALPCQGLICLWLSDYLLSFKMSFCDWCKGRLHSCDYSVQWICWKMQIQTVSGTLHSMQPVWDSFVERSWQTMKAHSLIVATRLGSCTTPATLTD